MQKTIIRYFFGVFGTLVFVFMSCNAYSELHYVTTISYQNESVGEIETTGTCPLSIDCSNLSPWQRTLASIDLSTCEPKSDEYTFVGWCSDDVKNCTSSTDKIFTNVCIRFSSNPIVLYAKWNVCSISFDLDGGSWENAPEKVKVPCDGNTPPLDNKPLPKKSGYVFGGFWTADHGRTYYDKNLKIESSQWLESGDTTLYAKWFEVYELDCGFYPDGCTRFFPYDGNKEYNESIHGKPFELDCGNCAQVYTEEGKVYSVKTGEECTDFKPKYSNYMFNGWKPKKCYEDNLHTRVEQFSNTSKVYADWTYKYPSCGKYEGYPLISEIFPADGEYKGCYIDNGTEGFEDTRGFYKVVGTGGAGDDRCYQDPQQ